MFSRSVLAGVPPATLQQWLAQAQTAYASLMTGVKAESVSYAQGDGTRSVTYTRANVQDLVSFIDLLQQALGIGGRRRALKPYFR